MSANENEVEATPQSQALVVTQNNFLALNGDKYQSLLNGIQFEVDNEGKLATIKREEFNPLIDTLATIESADNWWVGDTAAALQALYGDEAVADFAEKLGEKNIDQVKKWASVSRAFGFPNKIAEMRHPDPKVSHAHHQKVQGMNKNEGELKQRMKLLQEASDEQLSVTAFYERVKQFKAGPGAETAKPGNDLGVFKPAFRVYDKEKDNPEQFLQEFNTFVTNQYFPEYLNPTLRLAREEKENREKLADKLPAELKSKVLLEHGTMEMESFEKLVNQLAATHEERKKIEKHSAGVKDEKLRAELLERAKTENLSLDAFKEVVKKAKEESRLQKRDAEKIDKLIGTIKNPEKRSEVYTTVHENKLLLVQVEEMVKPIIADELIEESAEAIRKKNAEKTENQIQARADAIRKQQLEGKPEKKASGTGDLPLGKKSPSPKKSKKKAPEQAAPQPE